MKRNLTKKGLAPSKTDMTELNRVMVDYFVSN